MKQIPLWNEISDSKLYGKKWLRLSEAERINRIASEVHARLAGKDGEKILTEIAKKKGASGIVAKLRQWLKDFWNAVRETFGKTWTNDELAALTLQDFVNMTLRDFTEGAVKQQSSIENRRSNQGKISIRKKETWRDRATNVTTRLLPYSQAQQVNRLLE